MSKDKKNDLISSIKSPSRTLSEQAYDLIEEKIISLQLTPGEVISETALAKELAIGRTPIREALQKLVNTGLIVILPHKGILVTEISPFKQLQLLELRQALDQLIVRSAAIRSTLEQKSIFKEIAVLMEKSAVEKDSIGFMYYDNLLHILISQAAGNEYLIRAMEIYHSLCRRFWYWRNKDSSDISLGVKLHVDLAICISLGDSDKSVDANNKLISNMIESAITTLKIDFLPAPNG
jgi:DNA-binding GntR family transcriptional regulator